MLQARFDLKAAEWNSQGNFFSTACFLAQQAAEKALKSLLYFLGTSRRVILSHSTFDLLQEAMRSLPELSQYLQDAKELDLHYIPSRYPNGLPAGYPHGFYSIEDSTKAISSAKRIIEAISLHYLSKGFSLEEEQEQ